MPADTADPSAPTRIAFGSCQSPYKRPPSSPWPFVAAHRPQLFIWAGDVTYAKGNDIDALRRAYEVMPEEYRAFASERAVVGTWDDHDYGQNDGGEHVPNREARRDLFLDFLNVPLDSPRRKRRGVYASHDFGSGNESVRIILLDTRFDRSNHVIPSIGHWGEGSWVSKITALVAASVRLICAKTGLIFFNDAERHILSSEQWAWLADQLATSQASVNILVSSIQVLTTNPSMESFGHFPSERLRLLALLRQHRPKGLLIVSGDVHVADLLGWGQSPVEATSSGLTHSCSDSLPRFICQLAWQGSAPNRRYGSAFADRNFGLVSIDWSNRTMRVDLLDIPSVGTQSQSRLGFSRSLDAPIETFLPSSEEPAGLAPGTPVIIALWGSLALVFVFFVVALCLLLARPRPQQSRLPKPKSS